MYMDVAARCVGRRNGAGRSARWNGELRFEIADRIGDGGLCHAEFGGGGGEAQEATGALEDDEIAGGRQEAAQVLHKRSLCKMVIFSKITGKIYQDSF